MGMMFSRLCELIFPDELWNGAGDSTRRRFPKATSGLLQLKPSYSRGERMMGRLNHDQEQFFYFQRTT
jgi:hypothetical protein